MARQDLSTLANVKAWVPGGLSGTGSDSLLQRLLSAVSIQMLNYAMRDTFLSQTYTEYYSGGSAGDLGTKLVLRHWPVTSVTSVIINGQLIPQASSTVVSGVPSFGTSTGWSCKLWNGIPPGDPGIIELTGYRFTAGSNNIAVTYIAGYLVQNEVQAIPSTPYQITADQPQGAWLQDAGVTYVAGGSGSLTAITSGTPSIGQYLVASGVYTFSAADSAAGAKVALSYSFVPFDVEQAALEMVNERFSYRTRPGLKSKGLASQETMSYETGYGISPYAMDVMQTYMNMGAH